MRILGILAFLFAIVGCDEQLMSRKLIESATGGPAFTTADAEPDAVMDAMLEDAAPDAALEPDAPTPDMAPIQPDVAVRLPDLAPLPADASPDAEPPIPEPVAPAPVFSELVFQWDRGEATFAESVYTLSLLVQCVNAEGRMVWGDNTRGFQVTAPVISLNVRYIPGQISTCYFTLMENEAPRRNSPPPGSGTYTINDGATQNAPLIVDPESPVCFDWSVKLD